MLDGDLDEFMAATLAQRAFGTGARRSRGCGLADDKGRASSDLGRMGHGMAGRYLDAGFTVAVWNRSKAKAEDLIARGARGPASPEDAADRRRRRRDHGRRRRGFARGLARRKDGAAATMKAGTPRDRMLDRVAPATRSTWRANCAAAALIYIDCPRHRPAGRGGRRKTDAAGRR